jgi:hypothetical protein
MRMVFETLGNKARLTSENLQIADMARANAAGAFTGAVKRATIIKSDKCTRYRLFASGAYKTARMVFGALDRQTRVAGGNGMSATVASCDHARTLAFSVKHAAIIQSGE